MIAIQLIARSEDATRFLLRAIATNRYKQDRKDGTVHGGDEDRYRACAFLQDGESLEFP